MPKSKMRKKTKLKNKNARKAQQGLPGGKEHRIKAYAKKKELMKEFMQYVKDNKDKLTTPEEMGLPEDISFDDIEHLAPGMEEALNDDPLSTTGYSEVLGEVLGGGQMPYIDHLTPDEDESTESTSSTKEEE